MKISKILLWGSIWGIIYFTTNNILLFAPHSLPLLPFEIKVRMNEWWMIPYISWLIYIIIFCLMIKKNTEKFTKLITGLVLIHAFSFILFPIEYPRTYDFNSLCAANQFLLSCDHPRNCLPSLHVSFICVTIIMASRLSINKKMYYLFVPWGMIIIISTVLTKQHYIIDVLAGMMITTIYFLIIGKKMLDKQGS